MRSIIFDVDTQNDLCKNKRSINKNVSSKIISNIEHVLITAIRNQIVILGSVISHENNCYGYCEVNTYGHEKINETMMVEPEFYYNVANTKNGIDLNVAEECWQIVFEKQISDVWDPLLGQPDNLQSFLRHENIDTVYIVGTNFNDSVIHTIHGFIARKYNVRVVSDAINWITTDDIIRKIVPCISTEECLKELEGSND